MTHSSDVVVVFSHSSEWAGPTLINKRIKEKMHPENVYAKGLDLDRIYCECEGTG